MTEVSLIARIKAEGAGIATKALTDFSKAAINAESSTGQFLAKIKGFRASTTDISGVLKAGVATVAAFGAGITAIAVKAGQAEDRVAELSAQSGIAVDRFKELQFAFEASGSSAEGLADTSRKVSNELGQFIRTGQGGFAEVFEAIKGKAELSTEALSKMSGIDGLQAVKNALDEANVPLQTQGNLLDGLARGASKLLPLLAEQGAELNGLTSKYRDFNDALKLTGKESEQLGQVADEFDLLKTTMGNAASFVVAKFAPEIISSLNSIARAASDGAQAIVLFADKFRQTSNIKTIEGLNVRMAELIEKQGELEEQRKRLTTGSGNFLWDTFSAEKQKELLAEWSKQLPGVEKQLAKVREEFEKAAKQKANLMAEPVAAPAIADPVISEPNQAELKKLEAERKAREERLKAGEDFLKQIAQLNKTEVQLAEMAAEEMRKTARELRAEEVITEKQKAEAILEIDNDLTAKKIKIMEERAKAEKAIADAAAKEKAARQKEADDFINQIRLDGLDELGVIEEVERQKLAKLEEFHKEGLVKEKAYQDGKASIEREAAMQAENFRMAQRQLALSAGEELFGALAEIQGAFGDKTGSTYKVLFGLQKGFALASAIMNMSSAIAQSMADPTALTPAQKFANAAAVGTSVANVVSNIASLDYQPREQGGQFRRGQNLLVGEKGAEIIQFGDGKAIRKRMAENMPAEVRDIKKKSLAEISPGKVKAGDRILVGGEGAQILKFPMGGRVLNASDTAKMIGERQQGGQFRPSQNLLVGEKGPEVVKIGDGSRLGAGGISMTIINQTTGRIDRLEKVETGDDSRMVFIAKETIVREINNPNSETNKALDRTRNIQRRLL